MIAVFAAVVMCAQTSPFAGLGIVDYKIKSAWPESFKEVSGSVDATINNTGTQRAVRNIKADVYRNGAAFASGTCDDVMFVKGRNTYTLNGRVKLAGGVSIWSAIAAAFSFNPKEYVVEVTMTMYHEDGRTEDIKKKVPVSNYLK